MSVTVSGNRVVKVLEKLQCSKQTKKLSTPQDLSLCSCVGDKFTCQATWSALRVLSGNVPCLSRIFFAFPTTLHCMALPVGFPTKSEHCVPGSSRQVRISIRVLSIEVPRLVFQYTLGWSKTPADHPEETGGTETILVAIESSDVCTLSIVHEVAHCPTGRAASARDSRLIIAYNGPFDFKRASEFIFLLHSVRQQRVSLSLVPFFFLFGAPCYRHGAICGLRCRDDSSFYGLGKLSR